MILVLSKLGRGWGLLECQARMTSKKKRKCDRKNGHFTGLNLFRDNDPLASLVKDLALAGTRVGVGVTVLAGLRFANDLLEALCLEDGLGDVLVMGDSAELGDVFVALHELVLVVEL